MKKPKERKIPTAALLLALAAASFLLDDFSVTAIKQLDSPLIAKAVETFNSLFLWAYGAMLVATATLMFRAKKNNNEKILAVTISILGAMAVTYLLKPLLQRMRPDGLLILNPFGNIDYSFPSGHSASAAAAALSSPVLKAPWAVFTAVTIFSRIYGNAHHFSDTMAGLAIAAIIASFVKARLKGRILEKDKLEVRRQVLHAAIGIAIALFVLNYQALWYVLPVIAAAGLLLSVAIRKGRLKVRALALVERKEELTRFPGKGAIMLFLGSGLTAAIFKEQAAAAILILAIGDSISPVAGSLLGKARHRWLFAQEKMIEGTLAGIVFAAAAAALLVPAWIAIVGAAAAMIVEAMNVKILGRKIDDNILVPIMAAAAMHLLA
ncbi:phosphatase PAP2 family protein [Candidatus Woesearchaeota archaeon]|nr:phosphatase PAP2 family protein [Candidatus Woesearchaeota archaeon]